MIEREAASWIGYFEHASEVAIEVFNANIGKGGCTIFSDFIRRIYPWRNFMGLPWCTVFVHAVVIQSVGKDRAKRILGKPHPGSRVLARRIKRKGRLRGPDYLPQPGDLIFCHNGDGRISHCGIVEFIDGNEVVSIEGNTIDPAGRFQQHDGGVVARRRRQLADSSIVNYGYVSDEF